MADGDAAAAIGMTTVPATEDKRLGYRAINRALDYIAAHITSGTHPASAITSGILPTARGGTGSAVFNATNVPTTAGNVQADLNFIADVAVDAQNGELNAGVYSRVLSSAYRALWIRSDGVTGYVPSSRQFKQDIESAEFTPEQLLAIRVVSYRYIEAVKLHGKKATVEIGLIAEEVHDLGLHWLVDYDEKGKPFGVLYDRLSLAVLVLAQIQQRQALELATIVGDQREQIDELAARLAKLEETK